ncbi:RING-H2 finger protein ATL8-like [Phalaenopsis equestris]|uniref:RING-H2 finger protein ATL8-like n=1 Tax=Phalaenopsis equestris TaxID=78828 RepID=UPI0009E41638|nr:RING-H2 finger protein ATL8-like [Phalaenopsis equestris]
MPPATRNLQSRSAVQPAGEPPEPVAVDSDVVVILAALLCALICVVGLALVARCAWLRRSLGGASVNPPPSNKGLKKKALRALPKTSFDCTVAARGRLAECPICLAEFVQGDEIRILPQCGHGFHVSCVDTWLGSNSSCPSCRQILVVAPRSRCDRCGASGVSGEDTSETAAAAANENGAKTREDGDANSIIARMMTTLESFIISSWGSKAGGRQIFTGDISLLEAL